MAANSAIEWCDATFNPWIGCTKVSPACDHCYAERDFDLRRHVVQWGAGQARKRTSAANWKKPMQWNRRSFFECGTCGWRGEEGHPKECATGDAAIYPARRRVFCASLADVFDNEVSVQWRRDLFDLIAATPNLDWLLLTKRIGNVRSLYGGAYLDSARPLPANVWLGATICNQDEADRDIPKLLEVPARVRFLSVEPMLGPIQVFNLDGPIDVPYGGQSPLHWVICGGESGPHARPMHPQWARDLRDQCAAAGVPFMFKQWGEWTPGENVAKRIGVVQSATWFDGKWLIGTEDLAIEDGHTDDEPDLYRIGKKAAGRLLDGVEHNRFPEVRA